MPKKIIREVPEEFIEESSEFDMDGMRIAPDLEDLDRTPPHERDLINLRAMERGAYDIQKIRIESGNRLIANFMSKLGVKPSAKKESAGKDEKKILDLLKVSYRRITDGVAKRLPSMKDFKGDELVSDYTELCLLDQYFDLVAKEDKHFRQIEKILHRFPLYTEYLMHVKGCGPAMSAILISEIDLRISKYPSSIWKYVGLDVAPDGKGRSKRKEHLVEKEYVAKDGTVKTKMGITFNPLVKAKFAGVLASSFLRLRAPHSDHYYNYRNRLENHPEHKDKTDMHKHKMACRYMIKQFFIDYYTNGRRILGLEVFRPYHEAKLGIVHGKRTC